MSYQLDLIKIDGTEIHETHELVEATPAGIHIKDGNVERWIPWSQIADVTITNLNPEASIDTRAPEANQIPARESVPRP
jgi:hypothetical protein